MPNKKQNEGTSYVPIDTTGNMNGQKTDDDKLMGMLAHLLGLLTGFVGPLIISC
jgi:hypothetical protein